MEVFSELCDEIAGYRVNKALKLNKKYILQYFFSLAKKYRIFLVYDCATMHIHGLTAQESF